MLGKPFSLRNRSTYPNLSSLGTQSSSYVHIICEQWVIIQKNTSMNFKTFWAQESKVYNQLYQCWQNDTNIFRKVVMPSLFFTYLLPMRFWNFFPHPSALAAFLSLVPLFFQEYLPHLCSEELFFIQGVESQLVEQKKDIIFFINRAKEVDAMLMVFYLTIGCLSSFAINAILAILFKKGSETPSVKEPDFFDQMFSFDSFYDAVMHLSVSGALFKTIILWAFIMLTLCTFTLSLYGVWSSLRALLKHRLKK